MKANSKFISFFCAFAMIISMFSSLITANAADAGIALSSALSTDGKTITVTATYANPDSSDPGVRSFNVTINVPDTTTAVTAESPLGFTGVKNYKEADKQFTINGSSTAGATSEGDVIAVITITLSEPLASKFEVALQNGSAVGLGTNGSALKLAAGTLPAAFTIVSPATPAVETPTPVVTPVPFEGDNQVAIKDIVTVPSDKTPKGVYVKVTKNGADAKYGEDYAAFLDGKELTEEEFENIQSGLNKEGTAYVDDVKADIIDKLVIKANNGTSVAAAPAYLNGDGMLQPGDVATVDFTGSTPTPTSKPTTAPTATPTARPTSRPSGGGGGGSHGGSTIASGSSTSGVAGTTVTTPAANFTDLDSVPWALPAINTLAGNGIVNGTSATTFEPLAPVTRAQFAKMVCITFGVTEKNPATPTFTDVAPTDWFYGYVEAAAATGIVMGVSDTEFDPNALITREQMAAMMYRAITINNITLKTSSAPVSFTDAYAISGYAVEAVNALSAASVINGMDDGRFAPQETATRAQAACIIYQYFLSYTN